MENPVTRKSLSTQRKQTNKTTFLMFIQPRLTVYQCTWDNCAFVLLLNHILFNYWLEDGSATFMVRVMFIFEDPTVTVKSRTTLFLYLILCQSVMLVSLKLK
jgi:hypothetical protein